MKVINIELHMSSGDTRSAKSCRKLDTYLWIVNYIILNDLHNVLFQGTLDLC